VLRACTPVYSLSVSDSHIIRVTGNGIAGLKHHNAVCVWAVEPYGPYDLPYGRMIVPYGGHDVQPGVRSSYIAIAIITYLVPGPSYMLIIL
jgi:hypothetical protein